MNTLPAARVPSEATSETLRIRRVDACTDTSWARLARGGSLFTSPPWLRAVCGAYGWRAEARIIADRDVCLGGVVSIDVDDHKGARRLSLPFCDRAEPILADRGCWPLLAADLMADGLPYRMRGLDADALPTGAALLGQTGEAAWHGSTTTVEPDELFAGLHPKRRRDVRMARRHGVEVRISGDLADVHRFFNLHLNLRKRKYRLLAQPREFFERIWSEFTSDDAIVTILAYLDGSVVAGGLYLVWGDALYCKFGASTRENLALRPNDLIYWTAMRWAHERGLRMVDWGLSDLGQPGLIDYKRKWADLEGRIITLTSTSNPPAESPMISATFNTLTEILTGGDVPEHITERAGALLYRYFC